MSEDFRENPEEYRRYRPEYPDELFSWLANVAPDTGSSWDCATGSGQAAIGLAKYFESVIGSDINESQIAHAVPHDRIIYQCFSAESTPFKENSIDLVTAACAVHWFNRAAFYEEVIRVCRPNGVLAVWTYEWPWTGDEQQDLILKRIKDETLGKYWPEASHLYFGRYQNLEFPFEELTPPDITIDLPWGPEELMGFISTWSASQRYFKEHGVHAVDKFRSEFKALWKEKTLPNVIRLPLYMRVGRVLKGTLA